MPAQTIYQSWKLRRKRLERSPATLDWSVRKEQIAILDGLLDKFHDCEAARQTAQFPAEEIAPPSAAPRLTLLSHLAPWKRRWEHDAQERLEPIVRDIAAVDPQASLRKVVRASAPAQASVPLGGAGTEARTTSALMSADLGELLYGTAKQIGAALLTGLFEEGPLHAPRTLLRLSGAYFSGMWNIVFHNDRRNAADFIIDELRENERQPEKEETSGPQAAPAGRTGQTQLFLDRRTILIHDVARKTSPRNARLTAEDATAMVRVAQRFVQRRAIEKAKRRPACSVFSENSEALLEQYAQRIVESSGQSLDSMAESFENRMLPGEDITKALYFNLLCISRAMRLLAERFGRADARGGWLTDAAQTSNEHLLDEAAGLLADPAAREWALNRFRLDLANGDPGVRVVALEMLARLGSLDDIGLLLDLSVLLPQAPGSLQERRAMLKAARKLQGCSLSR